jgi:hypothetical protein
VSVNKNKTEKVNKIFLLWGARKFNVCYEAFSEIPHVPQANPTAANKTSWLVQSHPQLRWNVASDPTLVWTQE